MLWEPSPPNKVCFVSINWLTPSKSIFLLRKKKSTMTECLMSIFFARCPSIYQITGNNFVCWVNIAINVSENEKKLMKHFVAK